MKVKLIKCVYVRSAWKGRCSRNDHLYCIRWDVKPHSLSYSHVLSFYLCLCFSVYLRRSLVVAHADQVLAVHMCRSVPRHCYQGTSHLQHCLHASIPHLSYHFQGISHHSEEGLTCKFLNKMSQPNSCLHHLFPEKWDDSILSWLRNPLQYCIPYAHTVRLKRSFVLYALHSFSMDIAEDFWDDFSDVVLWVYCVLSWNLCSQYLCRVSKKQSKLFFVVTLSNFHQLS